MKNTIAERIFDFLKDFPPFNILQKEQLMQVASSIKVHYFEKDKVVFNQTGEPHDCFYIVKDGAVGLYREMNDESILVDICDEGDIFGLRPVVQNDHYLMSAKTNEESVLYAISVPVFKQLISENKKVSNYIVASFSTNIKTPYAANNNGDLFANEATLKQNIAGNNASDAQTAQFSKNPVCCPPATTIKNAALTMSEKRVGSILITEQNKPIGIITDKDLRLKVATGKVSIEDSVKTIMSSPVITFHESITVAEAQIAMLKHKITHLCITKDGTQNSDLVGILSEHDIVVLHGNNPSVLIKELKRAKNVSTLIYIRKKASQLLKNYIEQQIPITFIATIISEINQAITDKAIAFSLVEMPTEPPVKFAWLALGSQGRKEQLLITDQDNALVFDNVETNHYDTTKNYFMQLAKKITNTLHLVGFEYCPAQMMASNPRWCLSLNQWQQQFNDWITKPTEEAIMHCTIFFDYTKVYGDETLVNAMTESIFDSIHQYEIFLNFLGKNTLKNPPPLGFFRQFLVEHNGAHKDQFDLKSRALMPLIDAARLLTLASEHPHKNNTIERLQAMVIAEPQNSDLYEMCIDAFKILLRFRTEQGILNNDSGRYINLHNLNKVEKLKLKGCFKPIKDIQELITTRFKLSQMAL